MKEMMKRILVVLVAILMVSSVLFAGPVRVNYTNPKAPTTDGAIWGGKVAPPTEGAIWGGSSVGTTTQHGNSQHSNGANASAQGAYHQSLVDLIKSLGKGLGILVEGAVWG